MSPPIFYEEYGGIRKLQNSKPVFYKFLNNGKKKIMTNADIRNPMIQPYDRFDYELIIKEVKPNEFVYRRTVNQTYLNNNNTNNAEVINNNSNIFNKLSRPASPVSEGDPVSPISEYSVSSTPKAFGKLPTFLSRRSRRLGCRGRRGRKTLRRRV
jgi:hypothetical protein